MGLGSEVGPRNLKGKENNGMGTKEHSVRHLKKKCRRQPPVKTTSLSIKLGKT